MWKEAAKPSMPKISWIRPVISNTILACDGQTDQQTDSRTHDNSKYHASTASHGKKVIFGK